MVLVIGTDIGTEIDDLLKITSFPSKQSSVSYTIYYTVVFSGIGYAKKIKEIYGYCRQQRSETKVYATKFSFHGKTQLETITCFLDYIIRQESIAHFYTYNDEVQLKLFNDISRQELYPINNMLYTLCLTQIIKQTEHKIKIRINNTLDIKITVPEPTLTKDQIHTAEMIKKYNTVGQMSALFKCMMRMKYKNYTSINALLSKQTPSDYLIIINA